MALVQSFSTERIRRVCCIGAGYVGGPTCVVMAAKCPWLQITVVDLDQSRIKQWNEGPLPIHEPGLENIVEEALGRNLFFTTDVGNAINDAELVFISVNTPTKRRGKGVGFAADLNAFESAARSILSYSKGSKIIVEKSTVPCKTAEYLSNLLNFKANRTGIHFEVLSNPEFLAEGTAVRDLINPDRVIIGGLGNVWAQDKLAEIYESWIPKERILRISAWSSELAKLTANAMLAQRVSSINSISAICEEIGANIEEVAKAVGLDSRIGSKFLSCGLGYGGSCFKKDILSLVYLAESLNLPKVAAYWKHVEDMNTYQRTRFFEKIVETLFNNVTNKQIAVFGFAFKKNTGDTRESPAIDVVGGLLEEGAIVHLYDPLVKPEAAVMELNEHGYNQTPLKRLRQFKSPYDACTDSDAIVICTDWEEFRDLDYGTIYKSMRKPSYLFDGRLVTDDRLGEVGYNVYCIGKGTKSPGGLI